MANHTVEVLNLSILNMRSGKIRSGLDTGRMVVGALATSSTYGVMVIGFLLGRYTLKMEINVLDRKYISQEEQW